MGLASLNTPPRIQSVLTSLLAHRPGFSEPTQAARRVATLDNLIDGRLWLHIITGGVDADQRRDGDYTPHDERYERTDEYLDVYAIGLDFICTL